MLQIGPVCLQVFTTIVADLIMPLVLGCILVLKYLMWLSMSNSSVVKYLRSYSISFLLLSSSLSGFIFSRVTISLVYVKYSCTSSNKLPFKTTTRPFSMWIPLTVYSSSTICTIGHPILRIPNSHSYPRELDSTKRTPGRLTRSLPEKPIILVLCLAMGSDASESQSKSYPSLPYFYSRFSSVSTHKIAKLLGK